MDVSTDFVNGLLIGLLLAVLVACIGSLIAVYFSLGRPHLGARNDPTDEEERSFREWRERRRRKFLEGLDNDDRAAFQHERAQRQLPGVDREASSKHRAG